MAKLPFRPAGALLALAVLLLAASAPATAAETRPEHRVGDVLLFHRQAWSPAPDGGLLESAGPALRLELLDVQMRRDALGVERPTLLVALTLAPWTYADRLVPEDVAPPTLHLMLDAATGLPYGVAHQGALALGTPEAPPATLRALLPDPGMPCLAALAVEAALGRPATPAALRNPCLHHGHALTPGLAWTPAELPAEDGALAVRAAVEPRAEVYAWTPAEGGAPARMSVVFPFGDARAEVMDYLSAHERGAGPSVLDALAKLGAPRGPVTPRLGSFLEDGPRENAAAWGLPLAEAQRALRESAGGLLTRSYLAARPDAALTTLDYDGARAAWTFVWSDAKGEGHGVRVLREEGATGASVRVETLLPAEYADRVFALPRNELPASALTVDSLVELARAHLPPEADGRAPTALSWTTFARAASGEESNRRLDGPVSFAGWRASVAFAEGATDVVVDVDPRDGRILGLVSAAWDAEPVPLTARAATAPPRSMLEAFGPTPARPAFLAPTLLVGGAAAASLLGVAFSAAGREALTRVLVLPLYARIRADDALDHPMRRRILDALRANPGAGVMQLCDALGSTQGTVRYHLGVLVSRGYVREDAMEGITGYRLAGASPADARLAMVARHPNAERIHRAVASAKPGMTLREVVESTGVPAGAAYHHLMRLAGRGLVRVERRSRALRYVAVDAAEAAPTARVPA